MEITFITAPDCEECFDARVMIDPLEQSGQVKIARQDAVEYTSAQGRELLEKYAINNVPTLLIRGQTESVFDSASFTQYLGTVEGDGTLVVRKVPPPYKDLASGAVRGKFSVTYIADKTCAECYDAALHRRALDSLLMNPAAEKFVDRGDPEGAELIRNYSIKTLPTIVMTGELDLYPQLAQVWSTVGTIENDGAYIFRHGQELVGKYLDLTSGQVVEPAVPAEAPVAQ